MNFVEELKWRGMINDIMPGAEEQLNKEMTSGYVGIDPTADSLHIGHLVGVMMLKHLQRAGHRPIALIGGATGMIGDPSMKSQERKLIDEETLRHNQECIRKQLAKFLDFDSDAPNHAIVVNNYDWMKNFSFLSFIRDIGKHITVNYMMAKDSVKKRLAANADHGMSFTEFSYQLLQGYDFLYLYEHENCKLQMGGSDQWGNITTGTELIRRMNGGEAYAITCPLITKADGGKFEKYIKIFTDLTKEEIAELVAEQEKDPGLRPLQKRLAKEITTMVHSAEEYEMAVEASQILFSNKAKDILHKIDEETLLSVFEGVPTFEVPRSAIDEGTPLISLLTEVAAVFPSKGEMRKLTQGGGVSINKEKLADPNMAASADLLLNDKYILAQKGKKNYFLLIVK